MWSRIKQWYRRRNKALFVIGLVILGGFIVVQLFYPTDRLPLFASIDGLDVSGWKNKDAAWQLDHGMASQRIAVKLGDAKASYDKALPSDIGLKVENSSRLATRDYPWYLRLVPTSLLWYGFVQPDGQPRYETNKKVAKSYLNNKLGKSCDIPAKNATLTYKDDTLQLVSAINGGKCDESEALASLTAVRPRLDAPSTVTIPVKTVKPSVNDEQATKVKEQLLAVTRDGVILSVNGKDQTLKQADVLSWLTFTSKDDALRYDINQSKANAYLTKHVTPLVAKPAGQTVITTLDFTVMSQKLGATGQTLDLTKTLASIKAVLESKTSAAKTAIMSVSPKVVYQRTYTHTSLGISALITHYVADHPGTFGVSFQELAGQGRIAQYNGSRVFVTASTYKLFVAYGTLKRVDAGTWKWSDKNINGGRDLATCFDDMIVKSDNECAKAMLLKIGLSTLTNEIQALGLTGSSFMHTNIETTPNDLRSYLIMLQNGSLPISSASRSRLLDAMKRQVYRQGIPAGASGTVADKVGFLWALLHDAAIVYSPKGTYVLVVMTDKSSWANIADLTRKIESLR
ncbi:hypothetical protein RAAC3_TM7C00001G0278 [Candidatus Saccharibacteria bacterium RAAC3_TM7_1]|nr:hypothetical protein RAAC3_TM7C00001G0278 [Candidatus Saccharibacteria bacterium RAAC3_TM7_1]HCZ28320.1 hypothetical protein [Candidatus Saccharibacteria bacterium]